MSHFKGITLAAFCTTAAVLASHPARAQQSEPSLTPEQMEFCGGPEILHQLLYKAANVKFGDLFGVNVYSLEKSNDAAAPLSVIELSSRSYSPTIVEAFMNSLNSNFGSNSARFAEPADYKSNALPSDVTSVVIPRRILTSAACKLLPVDAPVHFLVLPPSASQALPPARKPTCQPSLSPPEVIRDDTIVLGLKNDKLYVQSEDGSQFLLKSNGSPAPISNITDGRCPTTDKLFSDVRAVCSSELVETVNTPDVRRLSNHEIEVRLDEVCSAARLVILNMPTNSARVVTPLSSGPN